MEHKIHAWWILVLLLASTTTLKPASAAFSCGDAVSALTPCGPYLIAVSGTTSPSPQCCRSAQSLNRMAVTVWDRQALCQCFKQTGPSFGVVPSRARQLPQLCKLGPNTAISPNVNCKSIK
ncbi:hypothetical protein QJS10_CPA10g01937 [Acorus calamus]|uniref:Bifunctional inhibitor/plant lipid transfer protein/seed storage helical domain-containing protein n=1 Tax=Acorus calamus TaxID=4465 RepID=A0AAV9E266_ACOCL|nr:hypothetical protein QJS10_CPA10g01937 [Acorus calamus]